MNNLYVGRNPADSPEKDPFNTLREMHVRVINKYHKNAPSNNNSNYNFLKPILVLVKRDKPVVETIISFEEKVNNETKKFVPMRFVFDSETGRKRYKENTTENVKWSNYDGVVQGFLYDGKQGYTLIYPKDISPKSPTSIDNFLSDYSNYVAIEAIGRKLKTKSNQKQEYYTTLNNPQLTQMRKHFEGKKTDGLYLSTHPQYTSYPYHLNIKLSKIPPGMRNDTYIYLDASRNAFILVHQDYVTKDFFINPKTYREYKLKLAGKLLDGKVDVKVLKKVAHIFKEVAEARAEEAARLTKEAKLAEEAKTTLNAISSIANNRGVNTITNNFERLKKFKRKLNGSRG
tara:strand:- start:93 stop:1124 length:1032 start_codon:yes stop_codon:yes gene_type:complete